MKFFQLGQSLIEVLIATTVVAVVLTSLAAGLTMSLKTGAESKYKSYASFYAEEANEFFRRERVKLGWAEFRDTLDSLPNTVCILSLPNNLIEIAEFETSCSSGLVAVGAEFERVVTLNQPDAQTYLINVQVSWINGEKQRQVSVDQIYKEY